MSGRKKMENEICPDGAILVLIEGPLFTPCVHKLAGRPRRLLAQRAVVGFCRGVSRGHGRRNAGSPDDAIRGLGTWRSDAIYTRRIVRLTIFKSTNRSAVGIP